MADYSDTVRGKLKLKQTVGGKVDKKKSKKVISTIPPVVVSAQSTKTSAQLAFEETKRKRQKDRISQLASKSHKEKVAAFNDYLENLSEHYDIPKVGPG